VKIGFAKGASSMVKIWRAKDAALFWPVSEDVVKWF